MCTKTSLSMGVRLVFLFLNQRVIFIIFSCEIQKSLHIITDIFSLFPNHTDFNKEAAVLMEVARYPEICLSCWNRENIRSCYFSETAEWYKSDCCASEHEV